MISKLKRGVIASAIATSVLVIGAAQAESNTSTVDAKFTVDTVSVMAGSRVNLSIIGLDKDGKVDQFGEQNGSTIMAVVSSRKGEVEAAGTSGGAPATAVFEKDEETAGGSVRYVQLQGGVGKVNISYSSDVSGTDTVNIILQESFPNQQGGTTFNKIATTTKTITITAANANVASLDITDYTKGDSDGNGVSDADTTSGIDGTMTAGAEGGQITVKAYDSDGNMESLASGLVTVTLRGYGTETIGGNSASKSYTLAGNMVSGEAKISVPSTVTAAGIYYIEARLGGFDGDSIDMTDADTLTVRPVESPVKLKIESQKKTISDDATDAAKTKLTAYLLDTHGNKTIATGSIDVKVKDDEDKVSDTVVTFNFAANDNSQTDYLGETAGEVINLGTAKLVAYIENNNTIADSDPLEIQVVDKQLVADNDTNDNVGTAQGKLLTSAATIAGVAIPTSTPAFRVRVDAGNGADDTLDGYYDFGQSAGNDSTVSDGAATTMVIKHYNSNDGLIESTEATLAKDTVALAALFKKAGSTGEYYIIHDKDGAFGEIKVDKAISTADIVAASSAKYSVYNGHGQVKTAFKASWDSTTSMYKFAINENRLKLTDAYGNSTGASDPVTITSVNGLVSDATDFKANETESDESSVSYDPNKFNGDDTLTFKFTEPGVSGDSLTVTVPKKSELTTISLDVENTNIPKGGVVPVLVLSKDQNGDLYANSNGLFVDVEGSTSANITSVASDGTETTVANGGKISGDRIVLTVSSDIEETFKLIVRNGDGDIKAEKTFAITDKYTKLEVTGAAEVKEEATIELTATGGTKPYTATSSDDTKATVAITDDKITVTGVAEGTVTITIKDASGGTVPHDVKVISKTALAVSPATVEVEIGKTAEATVSGGKAPYTATSSADATATVTIADAKVTITGVAEGSATITVKDADAKEVTIAVTVKAAGTTTPKPLPEAGDGGKNSGIDKDGNPVSSDAKYYGGVSADGGTTYSKEIPEDKPITVNVKIEVDPAHKDKKGKYYVVAGYQAKDAAAPFSWFYKEDKSFVDWAPVDLATRIAYKETETLGTIEIEIVRDLSLKGFKGDYFVFLAYEIEDGSIFFNLPAIEFTIK